jgi:hypothetical protein
MDLMSSWNISVDPLFPRLFSWAPKIFLCAICYFFMHFKWVLHIKKVNFYGTIFGGFVEVLHHRQKLCKVH